MRDASHTCQHTVVAYLLLSQMSAFPAIKITQTAHRRSGYSLHNDLHTDNILVSWPLFYDPLQFKPKQSLLKQMKKVCVCTLERSPTVSKAYAQPVLFPYICQKKENICLPKKNLQECSLQFYSSGPKFDSLNLHE